MRLQPGVSAPQFTALSVKDKAFDLQALKGHRVLLGFYRNGACALCNLRIQELIGHAEAWARRGLRIVAVFESSPEDMEPYVSRQNPPFSLLADPDGSLHALYGVENAVDVMAISQLAEVQERVGAAAAAGFPLIPQAGANFQRLPAEFLLTPDLQVAEAQYSDRLVNHLPLATIEAFLS